MAENKGFYIEATEIIDGGVVAGYRVSVPENPGCEAFCEKLEDIIPTGCALKENGL